MGRFYYDPEVTPGHEAEDATWVLHAQQDIADQYLKAREVWKQNRARRRSGDLVSDDPDLFGPNEVQKQLERYYVGMGFIPKDRLEPEEINYQASLNPPESDDESDDDSSLDCSRRQAWNLSRISLPVLRTKQSLTLITSKVSVIMRKRAISMPGIQRRASSLFLRKKAVPLATIGSQIPTTPTPPSILKPSTSTPTPRGRRLPKQRRMTLDESQLYISRKRQVRFAPQTAHKAGSMEQLRVSAGIMSSPTPSTFFLPVMASSTSVREFDDAKCADTSPSTSKDADRPKAHHRFSMASSTPVADMLRQSRNTPKRPPLSLPPPLFKTTYALRSQSPPTSLPSYIPKVEMPIERIEVKTKWYDPLMAFLVIHTLVFIFISFVSVVVIFRKVIPVALIALLSYAVISFSLQASSIAL